MKRFLFLIIISNLFLCCKPEPVALNGKILKLDESFTFYKLHVDLYEHDKIIAKTVADKKGNYKFDNIPVGNYNLKIWESTFGEKIIKSIAVTKNETLEDIVFPDVCIPSKKICPKNVNDSIIPIVYGLPDEEMGDQANKGEIWLGGCSSGYCSPNWYCKKHELEF